MESITFDTFCSEVAYGFGSDGLCNYVNDNNLLPLLRNLGFGAGEGIDFLLDEDFWFHFFVSGDLLTDFLKEI